MASALDADKDNISDLLEAGGPISNGTQILTELDSDNDGLDDLFDVDSTGGIDSNGDGIDDLFILLDSDNDGLADLIDIDSDNDKIPDVIETNNDADFDGVANYLDPDSNNDAQLDTLESGVLNIDVDNDGIDDFFDADLDGVFGTDAGKFDENGDGINDNFFADANYNNQADYQELDFDQDGIPAPLENGASGNDIDNDGIDDVFDADDDGTPGVDSTNTDINNDGILDRALLNADPDNDGLLNSADSDSDGDGITDAVEGGSSGNDYDNDGIDDLFDANSDSDDTTDLGKVDHNSDGIHDLFIGTNSDSEGSAGDSLPDYLDPDSDDDGIADIIETAHDFDNDGIPNYQDTDADDDGISDFIESRASGNDFDNDGIDDNFDADADGGGSIDVGKLDANNDGIDDQVTLDYDDSGSDDYLERATADDTEESSQLAITDSDQDGIPDRIEQNGTGYDSDHDGIDDAFDADQDGIEGIDEGKIDENNDGLDDNAVVNGLNLDSDGDGLANYLDNDSDNDGISDSIEADIAGNDFDGDGIDDTFDANSDNDSATDFGKLDANDDGINDSIGTDSDGDGIADYIDADSDNDGLPDAIEGMVDGVPLDSDQDGTPNYRDSDSDNDGITDADEMMHAIQLAIQNESLILPHSFNNNILDAIHSDSDGDGISDLFDADIDGGGGTDLGNEDTNHDGINDLVLVILGIDLQNPTQVSALDNDANGIADYLEFPASARDAGGDADNDGISNIVECLSTEDVRTVAQSDVGTEFLPINCLDSDADGTIDLFDSDSDNDGLLDSLEKGPAAIANNSPWDTDRDGIYNFRDLDSDDDSLTDEAEAVDVNDDGNLDDDDGDGIPNIVDRQNNGQGGNDDDLVPDRLECPIYPNCPDTDGDGQPDYSDDDSDNDGIPDRLELYALLDTDNDGIADWYDADQDGDAQIDAADSFGTKLDANNDGITDDIQLPDFDNDGLANHQDLDSDNDGLSDTEESIALAIDSDNDGIDDAYDVDTDFGEDINNDGYGDAKLTYIQQDAEGREQGTTNSDDRDSDGIPDYLDLGSDSDNDGQSDELECVSFPECLKQDSDGDSIANFIDPESKQSINSRTDGLGALSASQLLPLLLLVFFTRRKKINLSSVLSPDLNQASIKTSIFGLLLITPFVAMNSHGLQPYIGSGFTYGKHELNIDNELIESEQSYSSGKKVYLGLASGNSLRYEISYSDLGVNTLISNPNNSASNTLNNNDEVIQEAKIKTSLVDVSGYYQFTTGWVNPYIKLGIASLSRRSNNNNFDLSDSQELKPLYGLGFDIAINKQWHLRNQVDFINGEDNYWLGLSLEYLFEETNESQYQKNKIRAYEDYTHTITQHTAQIDNNNNEMVDPVEELPLGSCNDLSSYLQTFSFRPQTAELEGYAKARLFDFARLMTQPAFHKLKLQLKGYAEPINQASYSLKLSQQRVKKVSDYLINQGVNPHNLISQGYGEVTEGITDVGVSVQCIAMN